MVLEAGKFKGMVLLDLESLKDLISIFKIAL